MYSKVSRNTLVLKLFSGLALFLYSLLLIADPEDVGYVVAWKGLDNEVWLQPYNSVGTKILPNEWVNSFELVFPEKEVGDLLVLSKGQIVVSYTELEKGSRNFGSSFVQFFSFKKEPLGEPILVETNCLPHRVVLEKSGRENEFYAYWKCRSAKQKSQYVYEGQDVSYDLWTLSLNHPEGKRTSRTFKVLSQIKELSFPLLSFFENGNMLFTWKDLSGDLITQPAVIRGQVFDNKLKPLSEIVVLQSYEYRAIERHIAEESHSLVTLSGNRFFLVYRGGEKKNAEDEELIGQMFSQKLAPISKALLVNSDNNGIEKNPKISRLNDGGFAISWLAGGDVFVRVFDKEGKPRLSDIKVDEIKSYYEGNEINKSFYETEIVGLRNGNFAVIFQGCTIDAVGCEFFSRTFNAKGEPVGKSDLIFFGNPSRLPVDSL